MGRCVEKLPHSCGTSDGLQVFLQDDGKYDGYCFSCGAHVEDPYGDMEGYSPPTPKTKSKEEIDEELREIVSFKSGVSLPARKLKAQWLDYFGYKIGVSRVDGVTPDVVYRPAYSSETGEFIGFSAKVLSTKATWWIYHKEEVDLFGWRQAVSSGAKTLYITEGQEDAVALLQAMVESNIGTKYEEFRPAVVSLTHGAASAVKQLSRLAHKINKQFDNVVLVFDMDEPGRNAAKDVVRNVFNHAKVAELSYKDANECVKEGKSKELVSAVKFNASTPKNSRIVWGETMHEISKKPAVLGVSTPYNGLTEAMRGFRKKETIYLGAAPKFGKSELVDSFASHLIKEHDWKVLLAKPEQANSMTYKRMAGKMVGKIFHDPKIEFDPQAYDEAGELMKGKLAMLDLYQHLGWKTLKEDIRCSAAEGVDCVFIDPITNLTNGMEAAAANTHLQEVSQELSSMAMDLDLLIFIMCHLRNPDSGLTHDRGGKILSSQFAGSRAMARSCNYMLGLEGNKDPDLDEYTRNTRELVIIEDREFGESCRIRLYYDRTTGLFNEVK